MKQINILLSAAMLLAASATFVSCSSDNEDSILNLIEKEGITTITVGAPTIEADGGKTRVGFTYDNALKLEWAAGDEITIKDNTNNKEATFRTEAGGSSASFTKKSGDDIPETGVTYTIKYVGSDINNNENVQNAQTQDGRNNLNHLTSNYQATVSNVNTLEGLTFSKTWAESKGGTFKQSSCLKFDLTLPVLSKLNAIKKIVISSKNSSGNDFKAFYLNNKSNAVSSITLNYSNLTSITGNETAYNLIGYFMVGGGSDSNGAVRYQKNDVWNIKVYFGEGENDYIYRNITYNSNGNIGSGKLGTVKVSKNWLCGWLDYTKSNTNIKTWNFNSVETSLTGLNNDGATNPTYYTSSQNTSTSIADGLYFITGKTTNYGMRIASGKATVNFGDGSEDIAVTKYLIPQRVTDFSNPDNFFRANRPASSPNATNAGLVALDVTQAGMLYVYCKSDEDDDTKSLKIYYQESGSGNYRVCSKPASKTQGIMQMESTGAGVFYIMGVGAKINIYAIKFVP